MTRQRKWAIARRKAGLCISCGHAAHGAARCQTCQDKRREATREYQRRLMARRRDLARATNLPRNSQNDAKP